MPYTLGKPITSIPNLMNEIEKFVGTDPMEDVYLRGQVDFSWGLLPVIGRKLRYVRIETKGYDNELEGRLLHQFRRYARAHPEGNVDEREILLLARHHGVPVRLLDWTSNPLVALYYACVDGDDENLDKDGAIWMFMRKTHLKREHYYDIYNPEEKSILKLKGVRIIYSPHVTSRITAQSGHFTTQDNPAIGIEDYLPPKGRNARTFDIKKLKKWRIPHATKVKFIEELQRCGINERALFPDLDGIARSIVRTEVLRSQHGGKKRR